jgi:O-succinylbenzoate synthase
MAKAGLELAYMDLLAQSTQQSLSALIGGTKKQVAVGVSLGIQPTVSQLLDRVERFLSLGYQRIKLKIKPGWDLDVVDEVRRRNPNILLSVDANSAYTLKDSDHLKGLDQYDLLMVEQPLPNDDLVDHAKLQKLIRTDICLDESIVGQRQAAAALELESCRIINIKIGRVGGYSEALPIHDLCASKESPYGAEACSNQASGARTISHSQACTALRCRVTYLLARAILHETSFVLRLLCQMAR